MKLSLVFLSLVVSSLTGCGGGSSGSGIPASLNADTKSEILKVRVLSESGRAKASTILKTSALKLPSTDVILNDRSSGSYDKQLSRLDEVGRKNLADIQSKCQITPKNNRNSDDLEVGKTRVTDIKGSASGSDCPVSLETNLKAHETLISVDREKGSYSMVSSAEILSKFRILDENMKRESMTSGYELRANARKIAENVSQDVGNNGRLYITAQLQGGQDLATGQRVPVNFRLELLTSAGNTKAQGLVVVFFSEAELGFGFILENGEFKYFFNGKQTTKEQIDSEFGLDFDELTQNFSVHFASSKAHFAPK